MAISLSSLRSSRNTNPPITLLYGVDGIGKTTLASEWPDPIYLPTEGERTPTGVDILTPGTIGSLADLFNVFEELLDTQHDFKTVIIDSLDGLEPLVWSAAAARVGVADLADVPYNKGPGYALVEWGDYLDAIGALSRAGLYVVQLAHPKIIQFKSPITDPYSRYTVKLEEKANDKIREKSDIVAFMNYRVTLKEKDVGFNKKIAHAEGGRERIIHLAYGAGFDAKSRAGTPEQIVYRKGQGFAELSKYFDAANDNAPATQQAA